MMWQKSKTVQRSIEFKTYNDRSERRKQKNLHEKIPITTFIYVEMSPCAVGRKPFSSGKQ